MKKIIVTYVLLIVMCSFAQKKDSIPSFDSEFVHFVKQGDTLAIELNEITLLPKHKFKSRTDKNYYYWFSKKVHKAYPYAFLFSQKLDSVNLELDKFPSKRKKKRYIKKVQKYVENEFTSQLKKLTRTEGRILVKLLHRQTGETAYSLVKSLRSSFKAFVYNAQAGLFKMSLKLEYNPANSNEDYLIEDVLQRAFQDETLEEQDCKLDFDADAILTKNKGKVDVEKYKAMFSKRKYRRKKKK